MTVFTVAADRPLVLVGPPGAGKSRVAPEVGRRFGRPVVETDERVESKAKRPIHGIIPELGESRFRAMEAEALAEALRAGEGAVVATGGGAVCDPKAWELLRASGALTALLQAPLDVMAARVFPVRSTRPHLADARTEEELLGRLSHLMAEREPWYGRCDIEIDATGRPEQVASRVASAASSALASSVPVRLGERSYVFWLSDNLGELGERLARRISPVGAALRCALIADETVARHHGDAAESSLRSAGFEVLKVTFPPGERSKSLASASEIIDRLLGAGAYRPQRGSVVVALGGGVTGDLAGFVASTLFRGCPLVQVPTTLLAMIDASVGGKTAVNHPEGKNLVGAFHQPVLVQASLDTLKTLDERAYRAGFGEVVKYGLLDPEWRLLDLVERDSDALLAREPAALRRVIRRCVEMKAAVVEKDPEEREGPRKALNLGHTFGQALEAATGYERWLHGEAVGLGLIAAARVGAALGLAPKSLEQRVCSVLGRLGLPVDVSLLMHESVLRLLGVDKKVAGDAVEFVVPVAGGGTKMASLPVFELQSHLLSSCR